MEFGFTEQQERFRKEIHDWFMNNLPENIDASTTSYGWTKEERDFWTDIQKKVCEKGLNTASWPKKYGGLGWTPIELGIYNELQAYYRVRLPSWDQFDIQGPTILAFGTEEQKAKLIPPIIRGEVKYFNAETEPESGSETANIQLRAVADGDYFILNGQKTFISGTLMPDYLFTWVRTADVVPKHRGISMFLVPADTPGITFRPQPGLFAGMQHDIFFDDVRVHKDTLIGELNRGFYQGMGQLEFERSGTGPPAGIRRDLDEFVQFCKEEKRNGKPLIEDPEVRDILARRACEVEVMRLNAWFGTCWPKERGPRGASITPAHYSKYFETHWAKETADILNLHGQIRPGSKWAKLGGRVERGWEGARSRHGGGTVEIYKNIVAERGLGLPRHKRPQLRAGEKVVAVA